MLCFIYISQDHYHKMMNICRKFRYKSMFKALFEKSHYIGEVGLDFSREYIQTKETQIHAFRDIVKLCEQCGEKVVSVHSLKSANTVLEILREYKTQRSKRCILL